MTLPSSGPLSLSDIQGEFGGSNPIGMNEYYAGGGLVPSGTTGTYGAVPTSGQISVQNFYGTSNFVPIYIEDVFSTWLYTGNGATQTITNGVNLSGSGGLVWIKGRNGSAAPDHLLYDTSRGVTNGLVTNSSGATYTNANTLTAFTSSGFSVGSYIYVNGPPSNPPFPDSFVSWTFRKQPKFFDVVTYTGDGSYTRSISHALGSTPGCVIIKRLDGSGNWYVWHRSIDPTYTLYLDATNAATPIGVNWSPNSSTFTATTQNTTNNSGYTYVAYLFAHDAGGFGLTGSDNVISCGSYVGNNTPGNTITLGYEPQWVLIKNASMSGTAWILEDVMRQMSRKNSTFLSPNTADSESNAGMATIVPTSTGFFLNNSGGGDFNYGGNTYIYIAIRRGPMKVPTVGTSVFKPTTTSASAGTTITTNITSDMHWAQYLGGDGQNTTIFDRLRGISAINGVYSGYNYKLVSSSTDVQATAGSGSPAWVSGFTNTGWVQGSYGSGASSARYDFTRAPNFFDIVCYRGNGTTGQIITHNLGVSPELIILKGVDTSVDWYVYHPILPSVGHTAFGLNLSESIGAGTGATSITWQPSATTFRADYNSLDANANNINYVAYLFATCSGVSKVGSYTGTAALQTIDCGFTTGARFVLIKRADVSTAATGYPWYVWDSARGISSGNDPYFIMNIGTNAEVTGTNYVDTTSVGFQVTAAASGTVNISGGKFIFLAIA